MYSTKYNLSYYVIKVKKFRGDLMIIYRVQPGDTLPQIAQRFGVPIESISNINGVEITDQLIVGMELVIPTNPPLNTNFKSTVNSQQLPTIETLGYYDPAADPNKPALINELGIHLTYLGVFEFPITESGDILGTLDSEVLEAASNNEVAVLPVLTNLRQGNFDPDLARTVLTSTTLLNNLIDNIISLLQQYVLIGIVIDFENLYPEDRNLFTNFIRLLSERLHSLDKILVLNLPAKWADWPEKDWVGFFDYNALGPLIDIAAIMTYEWGYREGPPQPTAPLPFLRTTLDYAIANNIPADKILMGMTLYGYDWELPHTPERLATTVTLPRVWDLARRYDAPIIYDDEVQQPFMTYNTEEGITREVWFENARSHYMKYQLVLEYNLRGVFYWIIHMPFPSTWYMVSNLFSIRKL